VVSGPPYLQFYIGDWLKDPQLSLCSPASRGVWIDLICRLYELNQGGKITATAQQLARLCRSSDVEIHAALKELQTTNTADIYEREGSYTVVCRRMAKAAELSAKRKQAGIKSRANREANPYQNPENEIEISTDVALERVREFARGEGIGEKDADWFFYKCEGNGWTNGGEPIRDWKATIRQWWRTGKIFPSHRAQRTFGFGIPQQPDPRKEKLEREMEEAERRYRHDQARAN
jgi:hypothetical protein